MNETFCKIWIKLTKRTTYWFRKFSYSVPIPAGTRRNNNVIVTSKRRFDVIITLLLRQVPAGMTLTCVFHFASYPLNGVDIAHEGRHITRPSTLDLTRSL